LGEVIFLGFSQVHHTVYFQPKDSIAINPVVKSFKLGYSQGTIDRVLVSPHPTPCFTLLQGG
jgi:hypothetical protein